MIKNLKRPLSILLSIMMILSMLSGLNLTVYADTVSSGTVGTASYTIDENGVLTVGSGSFNKVQWRDVFITTNSSGSPTGPKDIAKTITKVVFEDGATATDSTAGMFYGWTALQEADLSNLNTSNVTDMWAMFRNCKNLATVNLTGLNTTNVKYMDYMFYACSKLTSLNLSTFDAKNVTTMNSMFYSCTALESVIFGEDFDTSKVTDMYCMFYNCSVLKTLDLSRFSTANVTKMNSMFYNCQELTTVTVGSGWNTDNVTTSTNMFGGDKKLVGGAGTTYNSTYKDKTYAKIDGGADDPGYFTSQTLHTHSFTYQGNDNTITASCTTGCTITNGLTLTINAPSDLVYDGNAKEATLTDGYNQTAFPNPQIVYYKSGEETALSGAPSDAGSYIASVTVGGATAQISFEISQAQQQINYRLKENDFTTIEATGDSFSGTKELTIQAPNNLIYNGMMKEATLNDYDIVAFPDQYPITYYKSGEEETALVGAPVEIGDYIAKVTVNGVTAQVAFSIEGRVGTAPYTLQEETLTIGSGSFTGAQFIVEFAPRKANIKNVIFNSGATLMGSAAGLFRNWTALESVDLTSAQTNNVTSMDNMFNGCTALTNVTFGVGFDTSKVTSMCMVFKDCASLASIDFTGFNTAEVTNMSGMFTGCESLITLDISSFNTANVTNMMIMFSSCGKLTTIFVGSNWNTDAVTSSSYMFSGDTKLKGSLGTTYSYKASDMDKSRAHIDGGLSNPGYLTDKNHTHSFTYALSEDHTTITATCTGTGTCNLNESGENSVSIKISVPTTLTVFVKDNDPETIQILNKDIYRARIDGVAAFNAATGYAVRDTWKDNDTQDDTHVFVQYYKLENDTETFLGTEPPCKEAGNYRAKITIDNQTAYVDYSLNPKTYTITWKNYDDTVIGTSTVAKGETPTFSDTIGEIKEKPDDVLYTYTFSGWTPEVTAVTGDVEYTATFTATPKRTPADDVKDLINALPTTVTVDNKEQIEAARAAYNALSDDEKAKIDTDTLSKLTDAETALEAAEKAAADQAAADPVIAQINALPSPVTLDDKAAVEAARAAYNALTEDQKDLVTVDTYEQLMYAEKAIADLEAAKAVTDQINALPAEITLDDKAAVQAARQAYDDLSFYQTSLIATDTLEKLTAAEKVIADREAAKSVTDQINALPADITLDDKAAVEAARQAYNDLTDDQKTYVTDETLEKLAAAEAAVADLETAKAVTDMINALPSIVLLDNKAEVEAARAAYNDLTDDQKALVDEEALDKLTEAETVIADREAAKAVDDMVNALPDATEITLADKAAVEAADAALENLTIAQAEYVVLSTYGKLADAKKAIANLEAAKAVTDQINALPTVIILEDKADVEAARAAYNDLTDDQKALVDEEALDKLADAEKVIADREAAKVVEDMINALPDAKDITLADKAAVNAANEARLNLPPEQADYLTFAAIDKLFKAMDKIVDLEAAKVVEDQIKALPEATAIAVADKDIVESARAAYDALTPNQQALVSNEALAKLAEVEEHLNDSLAAYAVEQMIRALPENITLADKEAVQAARDAYNALTPDQEEIFTHSLLDKLAAAEKSIADQEAAKDATDKINALPEDITVEDKEAVEAARAAFDALTDDQRALVDVDALSEKLTAVEAALKDVLDNAAADDVIAQIDTLPAATSVTINDKDAIEGAKAAYDALTDDQKKLVPLEDKLKLASDLIALAIAEKNAADQAAADAVEEEIRALPGVDNVTINDKDAIEKVAADYDALTDDQKKLVSLVDRTKLAAVKGALAAAEDRAAAEAVDAVIKALPDPADVTLDDKAAIEDASAAYDALTNAQKLLVPLASTDKLQADKDAVAKIEGDIAAAQAVTDQINALPAAEDVALESAYEIAGARAAYNALTDDQKNLIDDETLNKLTAAEAALQSLVDVDIVERMINALPDAEDVTYNDKADIEDARAAYDALTDDQKALVNPETVDKLTAAEEALAPILEDVAAAQAVSDKIKALPAATKVTVADKAVIDEANDAYNALTDAQKSYVPLADKVKLAAVKGALDAAVKAAEDEAAAAAVEDMISALPNAGAVTLDDKAAIEEARAAYDALTPDQKRLVNLSDRIKLLADEAAIAKIEGDIAAAQAVTEQINALPAAEDVTLDDGRAIMSASTAYNALTPAQKALVDDEVAQKLTDDVNALNDLAAAEVAKAFINALPNAEDVTIDDKPVIEAVRAVYDNLTDEQKALVDDETYKKLTDAEDALQKIQEDIAVAQAVTNMINALPAAEDVTLDDKDAIEHARAVYDDITDDQKALIDEETYKKLTDAEEALEKAAILYGDANSDGVVDILDAARIQKAANERVTLTDEQIRCSDVNGDGAVDILDATLIQMFTSGTIDKFPVENV